MSESNTLKVHPRVSIVHQAELELEQAFIAVLSKHEITYGESIMILSTIMQRTAMYLIRDERHPDDPEKRGGEA